MSASSHAGRRVLRSVRDNHARTPRFRGGLGQGYKDNVIYPPYRSYRRLTSRKTWSEASCQVSLDLHSWVVLFAQTRQHQCALLTMSSSIFGAKRRIREPLTALAVLTGPDRRNRVRKHARSNFSQRVNDIGRMVYIYFANT